MITLAVIVGILCLIVGWLIATYNGLVRKRNMAHEGWSGIDVQLKRRSDLIPNLVATVKGYATHEQETLDEVTRLRQQAREAQTVGETAQTQGLLGAALGRLLAVVENYPELKADQNFIQLQQTLHDIEDQIQMARRYYNGVVRELNIAVESFPSNIVANAFHFSQAEFFELEDNSDRVAPKVAF